MKTKLLIVLTAAGLAVLWGQTANAGNPKPHKHHVRAVSSSRNDLPPGFGSATGSAGEGVADGAPPPDEPADDGEPDQPSSPGSDNSGGSAPSSPGSGDQTTTSPQVVTTPTPPGPGDVTTAVPAPPPYDACRNQNGIQPSVPLGQIRNNEGDCVDPPENNVGLCQGDQFILTPVSKVADGLNAGQVQGPWVSDGIGLVCWISDLVTYHANPAEYFFSGYYVGDGGAMDGLFKCPNPYDGWLLYPYYAKKDKVFGQVFLSQRCP